MALSSVFFVKLAEKYPFISLCVYGTNEYVGVIQNRDESVTTMYDFGCLTDTDDKVNFLELAAVWWWESNRSIPINIFLHRDWHRFKSTLRTFSNKDLQIVHGPVCSLLDISRRKSKRKSITLVRKVN